MRFASRSSCRRCRTLFICMPWRARLRTAAKLASGAYRVARGYRQTKAVVQGIRGSMRVGRKKDRGKYPAGRKRPQKFSKVSRSGNHAWQSSVTWGKYRSKLPKSLRRNHQLHVIIDQKTERVANLDEGKQGIAVTVGGSSLLTLGEIQDAMSSWGEAAPLSTQKGFIKNANLKLMGTNGTNQNIKITVYNVCLKQDIKFSSSANPVFAWAQGYVNQGGTITDNQLMGSTPYDSSYFGAKYTIWKTTNYFLSQGESFLHHTTINLNKDVSAAKLWDLTGEPAGSGTLPGYGGIKGITQYLMITLQCFPSHETTTQTNITTSIGSVDLIYLKKIALCENNAEQKEFRKITLLSNVAATALQVVNEDTGIEVNTYA